MITQNLKQTQNNIAEAAKKSGRTSDDILLVAVSKTKPLSALQEAYNAGIRDFGKIRCRSCAINTTSFQKTSAGI